MWVVKDSDTTIYLFGTVHILPQNVRWFRGDVKKAYDASSEVVLEMLNPDEATQQAIIAKRSIDPDGPPLTKKLSSKSAARYKKLLAQEGIPFADFETFDPWFAALNFAVLPILKAGMDPKIGVEQLLTDAPKRDGKKLGELENFEMQIGFFDTLPEKDQIANLESVVQNYAETIPSFQRLVKYWAKGDIPGLTKESSGELESQPRFEKMLLTDRNARWATWIENRLKQPGTVFVAVGALHLAGKNSVQEQLKTKKVMTKRIN
jgi:uncharacterized protein